MIDPKEKDENDIKKVEEIEPLEKSKHEDLHKEEKEEDKIKTDKDIIKKLWE